jgi:3-deoxy-D-manno-octulosonate 8-phosphate phosphatase (KDO 8-P phosphatase)
MDVDGVLTDGRIAFVGTREEAKLYDVKDGTGLWLARLAGLRTGVISGRTGSSIRRRTVELKMDEVHLKVRDKLAVYGGILRRRGLADEQVCYIGDDVVDLPILARVGLSVAVADAHPEVLKRSHLITRAPGGRGAVREVIDVILKAQGRWKDVLSRFVPAPTPVRTGRTRRTGRLRG